jgi:hypothetical protein
MAVEIFIVSGARRNERITLESRAFQVGCDPSCEVFFDPQRDTAAKGRTAKFCAQEGGWYVRCSGGEMWIGSKRIVGATHVRSGDVVRMSPSGPEFSFSIVADVKAAPGKAPGDAIDAVVTSAEKPRTAIPQVQPEASGLSLASADTLATNRQATAAEVPTTAGRERQRLIWIVGGLAVGILALVAVRAMFFPSSPVVINVQPVVTPPPPASPPPPGEAPRPGTTPRETPKADGPLGGEKNEPKKRVGQAVATRDARTQLDGAVFLIATEKADRYWPHSTCVAISKDTLLVTAFDAMDLAKMRDKDSYKIWVTRPADNPESKADRLKFAFQAEVKDIRVLAPYAVLSEKPKSTDPLFVNIGLLTIRGPLPKFAPLASAKELDTIDEEFPIQCVTFVYKEGQMTRHSKFETRLTDGAVFTIEPARQKLPGDPKLLHVRAEMPKNAFGSPVVNGEGKIIGVYADAIPEGEGPGPKNLHYATMVNPALIDLWLRDREKAEIWVPASPLSTPPTKQKQP